MKEFIVAEGEHLAQEEIQELKWAVARVIRPENYGALFDGDQKSRGTVSAHMVMQRQQSRSVSERSKDSSVVIVKPGKKAVREKDLLRVHHERIMRRSSSVSLLFELFTADQEELFISPKDRFS